MGLTMGCLAMMTPFSRAVDNTLVAINLGVGSVLPAARGTTSHPAKPRRNILRVMALSEETETAY